LFLPLALRNLSRKPMEKNLLFETDQDRDSFISHLKKGDTKTSEPKEVPPVDGQNQPSWFVLLVDLAHRIRESLDTIKALTNMSRDKFADMKFGDYFCKTIAEDVDKTDSMLNCFFEYLKVNSPLERKNTVNLILEEALKNQEGHFKEKKIKIFRKQYEKDLPETSVHEEQLRYMFNSILRYAIPLIPPNGSIGFMTKTMSDQDVAEEARAGLKKEGKYIEILFGFTCQEKSTKQVETLLGTPAIHREETNGFILRLVEELVQKNRGFLKIKADEEKPITLISLILPIERRKQIYFQSTD